MEWSIRLEDEVSFRCLLAKVVFFVLSSLYIKHWLLILPLFVVICVIWLSGLTYGMYPVLSLKPSAITREASLGAKACGRWSVQIDWVLAIDQHPQSALSMEQRSNCVCLLWTNTYLLHILYSSQFYMYRKSRAKKGKAGRLAGCTKDDATPSASKRQKVHLPKNLWIIVSVLLQEGSWNLTWNFKH
jgi:hypothetical protein